MYLMKILQLAVSSTVDARSCKLRCFHLHELPYEGRTIRLSQYSNATRTYLDFLAPKLVILRVHLHQQRWADGAPRNSIDASFVRAIHQAPTPRAPTLPNLWTIPTPTIHSRGNAGCSQILHPPWTCCCCCHDGGCNNPYSFNFEEA